MLSRLSIRVKLFLAFTLCVNIIIGLLSYLYYRQTADVIYLRNREATQQMLYRFVTSIDRMYKDLDRISAQILYNNDIAAYFSPPEPDFDSSYAAFVKVQKLTNLLEYFNGPQMTAKRILVFNLNGDYIDYGLNWDTYPSLRERFRQASWIDDTLALGGEKLLVPPRPTEWQTTAEVVFSVARRLNAHTLIEVQQPYALLEQTLTEGRESAAEASLFIYDDDGRIFYPYGASRIPFDGRAFAAGADGSEIRRLDTGETNVANLTRSSYTGLNVALLQPKEALLRPIQRLHQLSIVIIGAAELLALALSYAIARTITSPIFRLQRYVRSVELDSHPATPAPRAFAYSREVNDLYETFVKMTQRLHRSMNELIDLRSRESTAQIQALYAQTNPHFLYNTLTSIGRHAEEADDREVAEMCYALTQMLRYSSVAPAAPVAVREELANARAYLELMKLRYEFQLQFDIALDPLLAEEPIPKLIVQPFLENCFAHAFKQVEPPWHISVAVRARQDDPGCWELSIADNGAGIGDETLAAVRRRIETLRADGDGELSRITSRGLGHVGIENTLARCRLFWGDRVRFNVGRLPEGTEIVITVRKEECDRCSAS
ncbi:histidine kinase [Cohnella sp. GCM10012308]|uniref:sensor histidine kinase n=1 Tax=Cohnella sp. GCM10012308 TaxID=3317329 RepID=UPI003622327D